MQKNNSDEKESTQSLSTLKQGPLEISEGSLRSLSCKTVKCFRLNVELSKMSDAELGQSLRK